MGFWIVSLAIAVAALVALLRPILRQAETAPNAQDVNVAFYKNQLAGIEKDRASGVLSDEDAAISKTEISRRLLAAADQSQHAAIAPIPRGATITIASVIGALFIGGFALYATIGSPGFADMPLADRLAQRPSQSAAEIEAAKAVPVQEANAEHLALINQLKTALETRPDDLTGHRLLADNLAQLGRFAEARVAQDTVMRLLGNAATADDHAAHAEIMVVAAGGYVSPDAEAALSRALEIAPDNPRARFYLGLLFRQLGQAEKTYRLWGTLLGENHAAPWVSIIRSELENVAAEAGIADGPTAADIEAASELSETDRTEMIRNMVTGLDDRITNDGGTQDEWAQLLRAYAVLGETDEVKRVWARAQEVFANDAAALSQLEALVRDTGVLE